MANAKQIDAMMARWIYIHDPFTIEVRLTLRQVVKAFSR